MIGQPNKRLLLVVISKYRELKQYWNIMGENSVGGLVNWKFLQFPRGPESQEQVHRTKTKIVWKAWKKHTTSLCRDTALRYEGSKIKVRMIWYCFNRYIYMNSIMIFPRSINIARANIRNQHAGTINKFCAIIFITLMFNSPLLRRKAFEIRFVWSLFFLFDLFCFQWFYVHIEWKLIHCWI